MLHGTVAGFRDVRIVKVNDDILPLQFLLQCTDVHTPNGHPRIQRLGAGNACRLTGNDCRRNHPQHIPGVAVARCASSGGNNIVPAGAHKGGIGNFIEVIPAVKIADGADGIFKMPVNIRLLQHIVRIHPPGGTELGHTGKIDNVAGMPVGFLQFFQQLQLIGQKIPVYFFGAGAIVQGNVLRLIVPVEIYTAAGGIERRFVNISLLRGPAAGIQSDLESPISMIAAPLHGRHAGPGHQVGIAGNIHKHLGFVVLPAGFVFHNHALNFLRMFQIHYRPGHNAVKQQGNALLVAQLRQAQGKDICAVADHVPGRLLTLCGIFRQLFYGNLPVFKVCRYIPVAIGNGKANELLRHTENDLLSPAVAHGDKQINETQGGKATQLHALLDQQNGFPLPGCSHSGCHTGHTAAGHDDIIRSL